jgi:hypothetical protein
LLRELLVPVNINADRHESIIENRNNAAIGHCLPIHSLARSTPFRAEFHDNVLSRPRGRVQCPVDVGFPPNARRTGSWFSLQWREPHSQCRF